MPTISRPLVLTVVDIVAPPAYIRSADGKLRLLKVGDVALEGDFILTTQRGIVELSETGTVLAKPRATDLDSTIAALNADGSDAATAAGNASGNAAGFLPGVRLDRISESVSPAGALTTGLDRSVDAVLERATPAGEQPVAQASVNAAPVATSASASGNEDSRLAISLTGRDADGGVVSVTIVSLPPGSALLLADGVTSVAAGQAITAAQAATLLFSPAPDFSGTGAITFTVADNQGAVSAPAQVVLTVTAVNDAPVAVADSAITAEDTPVSGNLLANDSDADGPTLVVSQFTVGGSTYAAGSTVSLAGAGTLLIGADGRYTFTPAPNFNGTVPPIGYTVSDGTLATSSGLTLSVTTVNDAPVAVDDALGTDEDTPLTLGLPALLTNDSDPDGDTLSLVSVQSPVNGTVALVGSNVVFTPAPDYNGPASFTYTLSDGQGGTRTATAFVTVRAVVDPEISVSDVTVNEAAGTASFVVSLSQATSASVSVGYSTAAGGASAGADYASVGGTLSFGPGVVSQTITVPIVNDGVYEGAENFTVNLAGPVNATIADSQGLGTIRDDGTGTGGTDNDTPALAVTAGNTVEGGLAMFTVSLSNASTAPVVFTPSLVSGSALVGTDTSALGALEVSTDGGASWSGVAGNVTIAAGSTSVLLRLPATDDELLEASETFSLSATPVSGALATAASGTATIIDNDGPPSLFIDDVIVNEAAGTATFTVSLSAPAGVPVSVDYASADTSATVGSDYTAITGTLSFAPGVTSQTITVSIVNDTLFEGGESFDINLSAPVNATLSDATGVGTIRDDGTGLGGSDNDTPRVTAVSSPTVAEGANLDFSVTLSNASTSPTVVTLWIASGSATLGTDTGVVLVSFDGSATFGPVTGPTVTVPPGAAGLIVRLPTTDDPISEASETLSLTASTAANAGAVTGTGTITDNDGTPTLSINGPVTVNEAAGTITYTVTLSNPSANAVSVTAATVAGSASLGSDFTATSTVLTFAPGVTSQTLSVAVLNDPVFEGSETFSVQLSAPSNATIATGFATTTIADDGTGAGGTDNDTPNLVLSGPAVIDEAAGTATYTVTLSNASASMVTVTYATANGTAVAGSDYGSTAGTLSFAPGVLTQTISVPIANDTALEISESFTLNLSSPVGATIGTGSVTSAIVDDGRALPGGGVANDDTPALSVDDVVVNEAAGTATFTVSLNSAAGVPVTVSFGTASGSATAGLDFTAQSGSLTFAPGVTSQTISVPLNNDTLFEGGETFSVTLSAASNATIADATGVATIRDDGTGTGGIDNDTPRVATVSSPSVTEGGNLDFNVTLSNISTTATTVSLTPGSGSATLGADTGTLLVSTDAGATFLPLVGGTVSVPAGAGTFIVRVTSVDDFVSEGSETLFLAASTAANLAPITGVGTLLDNDGAPTVASVSAATAIEATSLVHAVTLTNPSSSATTYTLSLVDGSATGGGVDYTSVLTNAAFSNGVTIAAGVITVPAGVTGFTVTVPTAADTLDEADETYLLSVGAISAGGTIIDDDNAPTVVSVTAEAQVEGVALVHTVTMSNASSSVTTFPYTLGGGTATAGADYGAPSFSNGVTLAGGVLTVPAGVTTFTVTVPTTLDTIDEDAAENYTLSVGGVAAVGTITDDDAAPTIASVTADAQTEGTSLAHTVTLSNASSTATSFAFSLGGGTASSGTDYSAPGFSDGVTLVGGVLTVPAGVTSFTVTVPTLLDTIDEGASESYILSVGSVAAVGTINDDDAAPTIASISSPSVIEGGDLVYAVALSNASSAATTFAFSVGGGTAAAADVGTPTFSNGVTLAGGLLTVPAGVTSFSVILPTTPDTLNEPTETVPLTIGGQTGTGQVIDNDPVPSLSIDDVIVSEAAGTVSFTVSLSAASGRTVTATYNTANGNATAGSDYTAVVNGTVSFAPGVTSQTITVNIANDVLVEANETFSVVLSAPTNATIADGTGVATIADNDTPPVSSITSPTITEGGNLVYTVSLASPTSGITTYAYGLGGGTASATDYGTPTFSNGVTLAGGVLTVPAGVSSFTVRLPTTQDVLDEANETVPLSIGAATGTGTINDNDATPSLRVNDVAVNESAGTATFTVTLSAASGQTVSVVYGTSSAAPATASAGTDYTATAGTLTFAPGVTSLTLSVALVNDSVAEAAETFRVLLSTPTNATIADGIGIATITDNDNPPVLDLDANNSSGATGANFVRTYVENSAAVSVADADSTLTDVDSPTLSSATIVLTNAQAGDVLAVGALPAGMTSSVTASGSTITVTLSGAVSPANYNTAIRAVTFANISDTPSTTPRAITVSVSDGTNVGNSATTTINVTAVNDAPLGIDRSVSTAEDTPYRFSSADFRMNDAEDGADVTPTSVRIDTLPSSGALTLGGVAVTAGQIITAANLDNLVFTPTANASGANLASFSFSARDSAGAFDTTPNTVTVSVAARVDLSVQDVQHWTFNEGGGATTSNVSPLVDQVGTRTDGIAAGTDRSPTFVAGGHEGAGMQFNGIWSSSSSARDGGYVALASSVTDPLRGNGAGGGSASLVFWIRTTQTGGAIGWDSPSVLGMENNGGTTDVQWGWISSTGRIGFGIADEAGVLSANPVNDGAWHNVAMSHNFATGATEIWVDGVLSNSGSVLPGATIPNLFRGFGVTADDGPATDRYLNGTLDDVRIYDRALTASQIQAIYAVENNNLGATAVLDNDGGAARFNLVVNDATTLSLSGAPVGSTLTDGSNSVTIASAGQSVDITGWNTSELGLTGLGGNSAMLAATATGATAGDSVTQFINIVTGGTVFNGGAGSDALTGTTGSDFLGGGGGNDTITANVGDDRILGGAGDDGISAGAGNDVIVGGAGNDTMAGGPGSDVFQWQFADRGVGGSPAIDVITDFDPAARAAGGDVLDLRDLLAGESRAGGTGNLDRYLDFDTTSTPGSTIIRISSNGGFVGGTYSAIQEDERITLAGVDLRTTLGLGAGSSDSQVIQELLNRNKLVTDGP
jgi:hypothetical protein